MTAPRAPRTPKQVLDDFGLVGDQRTPQMRAYARELLMLEAKLADFAPRYPSATHAAEWLARRIVELERRLGAGHVPGHGRVSA
jgi:hypothetical protein